MINLHDYQQPHAEALYSALQAHGSAKDGSDCGTGKTPVAAFVAAKLDCPVIVVCPKILIASWSGWLEAAGVKLWRVINYEKLRTGRQPLVDRGKRGKTEFFTWRIKRESLIIWDEDHALTGSGTLNSRMCIAAAAQGYKQLFLGATSVDGPHKLHAMGYALGLHDGAGFHRWALEHGCWRDNFRTLRFGGAQWALDALHQRIYGGSPPLGSRMRIAELGDRFPMNSVTTDLYTVDSAEQIEACYRELSEQLEALDEKEEDDFDSELVLRLRARQRIELYKVPLLVDLVKQHLRERMSVALFVSFRDSVEVISEQLHKAKIPHGFVMGASGREETEAREAAIADFQANKLRVIVCIDRAGGVGIDLDDQAGTHPRVSLINPGDSAVVFKQVLGRIHRASSKSPAVQKIICAKGTADEVVHHNLVRKINNISRINDADLDPVLRKMKNFQQQA